jgi:hypothetical protein
MFCPCTQPAIKKNTPPPPLPPKKRKQKIFLKTKIKPDIGTQKENKRLVAKWLCPYDKFKLQSGFN